MKKKLLGVFIVFILGLCLFFAASAMILFLAPGVELFGIRYVQANQSEFEKQETVESFSGDIYIEATEVPININFDSHYASYVEFKQNFVGFTKTEYDQAEISATVDKDGNLHISTKEIIAWVYKNKTSESVLNISIAKEDLANTNLYINSKSSDVSIKAGVSLKNVEIVSGGYLNITDGALNLENFKYHTNKMITINDKLHAVNYDLKSTGSSISFANDVEGTIKAETKGGDVKFISCEDLVVKTGGGSIKSNGAGLNSVRGSTSIVTEGGDVTLGNVSTSNTMAVCNITSTSGDVKINGMKDGVISSRRGDISIVEARALVVTSKIGDIVIHTISEEIAIVGGNGYITLGEFGFVRNAKVTATTGKIEVYNAYGNIDLVSKSNKIVFVNMESKNILLNAGKGVKASNVMGDISVYSNGDIELDVEFRNGVSNNINVKTGSKTNNININAGKASHLDVDYEIESTKGKQAKLYINNEFHVEGNKLSVNENRPHKIKVKTSYGVTVLKLGL